MEFIKEDQPVKAPNIQTYSFKPLRAVRADVLGEVVYMETWHRLVGGESVDIDLDELGDDLYRDIDFLKNGSADLEKNSWGTRSAHKREIFRILDDLRGHKTPHDARIATSFILFLGTHMGQNKFLAMADTLAEKMSKGWQGNTSDAFVAAWAIINRREKVGNPMYQSGLTYRESIAMGAGDLLFPSPRNLELLEVMAAWLGTAPGRNFRATADAKLKMSFDQKNADFRRNHGLDRPQP